LLPLFWGGIALSKLVEIILRKPPQGLPQRTELILDGNGKTALNG